MRTNDPNPNPLLERDRELARIEGLLEQIGLGSGRVLLLEGPAGIGKTRLLQWAIGRAAERGVPAFVARGLELERSYPFGVVRQWLEFTVRGLDDEERARLFSGAAALARPLVLGGPISEDQGIDPDYPHLHGLYWLVAHLAEEGPLLFALDDAQWADRESLRFAAFFAARLAGVPVALLVATRPGEGEAAVAERFATEPGSDALALTPLSVESVGELIVSLLGTEPDPPFAAACHVLTGGNPFFISELLARVASDGIAPRANEVPNLHRMGPQTVGGATMARLARLGDAYKRLAVAVSILGDDALTRDASQLVELDEEEAAGAADSLADIGIFARSDRLSFTHPIVRAAVYEHTGVHQRSVLHRRAAELLQDRGVEPSKVAVHLLATEPAGDPAVVETLRAAARDAAARGALEATVTFLRRALAEPPRQETRSEVLLELGAAEIRYNRVDDATRHLEEALSLADGPRQRALAVTELGRALLASGRFSEAAMRIGDAARTAASVDRELGLRLEAEAAMAGALDIRSAQTARHRLMTVARNLTGATKAERLLLANAAYWMALGGATADEAAEVAVHALGEGRLIDDETADSPAGPYAIAVLIAAERYGVAESALETAMQDSRRRGSLYGFALTLMTRALLGLWRGDLASAEADARAVVDLAAGRLPFGEAYLVHVLVERGALDEADTVLTESGLTGELPEGHMFTATLAARGYLRLAQGRAGSAVADLREAHERNIRRGNRTRSLLPQHTLLAEALFRNGNVDAARTAAEEDLADARGWRTPRAIGRALRVRGIIEGGAAGIELFREAAATLAPSESRLELARALVDLGAAVRRAGRRAEARETLREGLELAQRCGADPLADRALEEYRAAGGQARARTRTGADALTPSERRVAEMANRGMSNAEIAQALFVTLRTVETQLTATYRKLGIRGRRELRAGLSG